MIEGIILRHSWSTLLEKLIAQLKKRQIFKVATIYAVSAWPLIQIADLSVPALGLPDSVMTLLLQVFVAGFPITLIFAWLFNFTTDGIVRASSQQGEEDQQGGNVKATVAVVGSLLLVTTVILATQLIMEESPDQLAQHSNSSPTDASQQPVPPSLAGKETQPADTTLNQKESIAILPFAAFSSDPEDEFFADGMVEELLNLLAKIPDLQVAARTSSFAYKGVSNKTIPEIGQELGVDTILEGSIRKNDTTNKIRVTAQLIKVSTGEHLWSETYDRVYQDIFQIQDDIANAVVNKMKITLLGNAQKIDIAAETLSIGAMVEHGKGQKQLAHRTVASINQAIVHFNRAVEIDPNYARAYVGVADANLLSMQYGNVSREKVIENANTAINKALAIDENFAPAYASRGLMLSNSDPEKAEASFKQAIALNPNYSPAYLWYGSRLKSSGKLNDSQVMFEKAFELDPKSAVAANNVAWGYYLMGDEGKAMEIFSQIITNDPYYPGAYSLAGEIQSNHGRLDKAANMYKRALEVDPINRDAINGLLVATMDVGDYEATKTLFEYVESHEQQFPEAHVNLLKARFYLVQNDQQTAMDYLERADFEDHHDATGMYFKGEKAFYKEEFELAISHYLNLKATDQGNEGLFFLFQNGQAAAHLAYAYQQGGEQELASALLKEFERFTLSTESSRGNNPYYYINMAQINILRGNTEEAFYYMQAAIDLGWVRVWEAENDPVFADLSKETQFAQMIGGLKAKLANMRIRMQSEGEFLLAEAE